MLAVDPYRAALCRNGFLSTLIRDSNPILKWIPRDTVPTLFCDGSPGIPTLTEKQSRALGIPHKSKRLFKPAAE